MNLKNIITFIRETTWAAYADYKKVTSNLKNGKTCKKTNSSQPLLQELDEETKRQIIIDRLLPPNQRKILDEQRFIEEKLKIQQTSEDSTLKALIKEES